MVQYIDITFCSRGTCGGCGCLTGYTVEAVLRTASQCFHIKHPGTFCVIPSGSASFFFQFRNSSSRPQPLGLPNFPLHLHFFSPFPPNLKSKGSASSLAMLEITIVINLAKDLPQLSSQENAPAFLVQTHFSDLGPSHSECHSHQCRPRKHSCLQMQRLFFDRYSFNFSLGSFCLLLWILSYPKNTS